jgi:very-short-patch-repair endonuclease
VLALGGHDLLLRSLFWAELRRQSGGLRFCRNYPTGHYVHDFYCLWARLAVSVECGSSNPQRDNARREWLARGNIDEVTVTAQEILDDVHGAVKRVLARAHSRLPHGLVTSFG